MACELTLAAGDAQAELENGIAVAREPLSGLATLPLFAPQGHTGAGGVGD